MWSKLKVRSWPLLLLLIALVVGCEGARAFTDTFDREGTWGSGNELSVEGGVANGVYEMFVKADTGLFWATKGEENAGAGVYELDATQVDGTLDNGFGMMFGVDIENENFYLFEISGDGFAWIGYCENGCETGDPLVGDGWIESKAVREGLNETNMLRVDYDGTDMIFAVNGQEVGRATNVTPDGPVSGDVGVLVETLGEGGVRVAFDNFRYSPLAEE
jgi:hypothetical protein